MGFSYCSVQELGVSGCEVQEGSLRARNPDAVPRPPVLSFELRLVGPNAGLRALLSRCRDIDRAARLRKDSPQSGRGAMTEDRLRAHCRDSGEPPAPFAELAVTNGID